MSRIDWMRRRRRLSTKRSARLAREALSDTTALRATAGVARRALRERHVLGSDTENSLRLLENRGPAR